MRLAAAVVEIVGEYENALVECQEQICRFEEQVSRSEKKSTELQRILNMVLQPQIKLTLQPPGWY